MAEAPAALNGRLLFVELGSPQPECLAWFYADLFGTASVERSGGSWICRGPQRCLIFREGQPERLLSAGYTVGDISVLTALKSRAAASLVEIEGVGVELFEPGAIALRDPDGNRIVYGSAIPSAVPGYAVPCARLQHLVVGSTNPQRLVDFYTNVVGMKESDRIVDDGGGLRTSFMRSDDEHHSLAVFLTSQNKLDHHCYELPDWNGIRDWADRLSARRIPVEWGPGRHGPGDNLFLFFSDPDGNWVEVSAELEVVRPGRPAGTWPHEERTLNSWGRAHLRS